MEPGIELSAFDYGVIAVYLVGILIHGLWAGRRQDSAEAYFLASRNLPWALIGLSLFASNMSGASFVGLMGASYAYGLVVFNYEWTAAAVLIFFAFFMLPQFLRARLYTIPEFLEQRFDRRSRIAYSAFTLLAIMFIDTAGALYAGGLVIGVLFPGLALWQAVAILALVAGAYTIMGGLKAVVVTDAVQAVLLIAGAAVIFVVGLDAVGGWEAMVTGVGAERLSLVKPANDDFLPWPGLVGVLLLGFYYWTLNQFIVQRSLAARSLEDGRRGALFAGLLKIPNLFLMIVPGVFAVLLYPDLSSPDLVFPTLAFDLLPVGLRGIILTALIAAIMSSLDSALNAAATLVTMDFVRPSRPTIGDRRLVVVGRLVTAAAMVAGALYAPQIGSFGSLFEYFQSSLAYVVPPVVAVYLAGLLWWRVTAPAAFWTLVSGLGLGVPLFLLKEVTGLWQAAGLPDLHFTYMSMLMLAAAIALLGAVSLGGTAPDRARVAPLVYRRSDAADALAPLHRPRHRDVRVQAAALAAVILAIIAWYW